MKVRVQTVKLIERVAAAKQRLVDQHQAAEAAYPRLEAKYRRAVLDAIDRERARIAAGGKLPGETTSYTGRGRYSRYVLVPCRTAAPAKPGRPDVNKHNQRLRELRLTSSEELMVDPRSSDWTGIL